MSLGIGVITYKRPHALLRTLQHIQQHTATDYYLVVADDGSDDAAIVDICKNMRVPIITGKNRGVAWNKNRALLALMNTDADVLLLMEDDCWPIQYGWDMGWIAAAKKFHHVNYAHPKWTKNWCNGGKGTPEMPWLSASITGQATATTRAAIAQVGFLDTRFKGFGCGHVEWTERFCKARLISRQRVPCMRHGLVMEDCGTFSDKADIVRNRGIAATLRREPFKVCPPWHSAEEAEELKTEVSCVYLSLRSGSKQCT